MGKKRKHKSEEKEYRKRKRLGSSSADSSSDSSSTQEEIKLKKSHHKKKKSYSKKKHHKKKEKKKLKKKIKEQKSDSENKMQVQKSDSETDLVGPEIPSNLLEQGKKMTPITKEEWEKKQSEIRRVFDEETGRYRLIRGEGEIVEEIVSRERHKAINKQATLGDGQYFQAQLTKR